MKTSIVLAILGIVVATLSIGTFVRFRIALNAAYNRLEALETQTVELRGETVEYCVEGTGPAVLVVHGNSGGHDQALQTGRSFFGDAFRFVAVSRFGYLGSDLPADSSPAAQARVYEQVLDREGIARVTVIGVSAGGAPSIRFALDYPERTEALVLVAPDVPSLEPATTLPTTRSRSSGCPRSSSRPRMIPWQTTRRWRVPLPVCRNASCTYSKTADTSSSATTMRSSAPLERSWPKTGSRADGDGVVLAGLRLQGQHRVILQAIGRLSDFLCESG
jgi:pimeloyl-ACP methyl ester carboxylesterase